MTFKEAMEEELLEAWNNIQEEEETDWDMGYLRGLQKALSLFEEQKNEVS